MKIGILGTGDVGKALGRGFLALGHDVKMGSRDAQNPKAVGWAKESGAKASAGTFADAASFGEVVVIATLGTATLDVLKLAKPDNFKGKLVIDTTNPLDFSKGMPPRLFVGQTDSLGEQVQRALPGAHVVKAFNTVGNSLMFKPQLAGGPPTMLIGGDAEGKKQASKILSDFGWEIADVGGIEASRYLEPMCLAWVSYGALHNNWTHAFKLLGMKK